MELFGKVAFVTGAGGGIGRKIALLFAVEGADLLLAGPDGGGLEEVRDEVASLGRRCQAEQADVADEAQVRARLRRGSRISAGSTSSSTTPRPWGRPLRWPS